MGEPSGAAQAIRQALSDLNEVNYFSQRGWLLGLLTHAYVLQGEFAEATISIEQALGFVEEQLVFRPELLRLRGEVNLRSGSDGTPSVESAEEDFRAAIDAARSMNAKSDELRATMSLATVLRDTNRRDEARTIVSNVYRWFTEGFDTGDLKEAKLMLDKLI